jgi:methylthioribulose-1-phosphate dehydratase
MATAENSTAWSPTLDGVNAEDVQKAFFSLKKIKESFASRGWFPATSGNLSLLVETEPSEKARPQEAGHAQRVIAITASGKDKSEHTPEDFLLVNTDGEPLTKTRLRPSAETLIHAALYNKFRDCRAVFHVHTVANNIISELYARDGQVTFTGHELIKALGIWEENASISVPIVKNFADIPTLAAAVDQVADPRVPGVLIQNHGIYVWGNSDFAAKRHLEAFEFLFEYQIQLLVLKQTASGKLL